MVSNRRHIDSIKLIRRNPKVFHFAFTATLLEFQNDSSLLTNETMLKLAEDSISSSERFLIFIKPGLNYLMY